jgi:hypothetical protein
MIGLNSLAPFYVEKKKSKLTYYNGTHLTRMFLGKLN